MRGPTDRGRLIRSLLDIRLSRFSLAVLAAVSVLATVVIITNGSGHTAAQLTALAALHEPPVATTRTVTVAAAPTTTTATPPDAEDTSAGGSDSGGGSGGSADTGGGTDTSAGGAGNADNTTPTTNTSTTATTTTTTTTPSTLPKVRHVFEIALSTTTYAAAFADKAAAPYLHSLEARGTVLSGYESLGHGELADYLAAVSGQAPNPATSAGCATYAEFRQGVTATSDGLVPGAGCVYPETALTIGDQVTAKGATWKAYIAGMGTQSCSHPNSGAVDDAALPGTESGYDTRHNPFIYFHSLLDLGDCAGDDQDLSHLSSALAHKSGTAKLSYIAPGACEDAAATATPSASSTTGTSATSTTTSSTTTTSTTATATTPAATTTTTGTTNTPAAVAGCPAGQPVGITAEDAFLKLWVPRILASAAYKDGGVLILAFAGEPGHPPGQSVRTGALVLSPYATKGKVIATAYTPYSLLRSVEDMLGDTALAHARRAASFAQAVLHKTQ